MSIDSALTHGPIIVGTDLSLLSKSILEYATRLAVQEARPLYLVNVMPLIPDSSPDLLEIQKTELQQQVHAAEQKLQGSGLKVEGTLVLGTPAHELIKLANKLKAACIVVGTEERSGIERLLLGSVAEAVIRKSDYPVIVVGTHAAAIAEKTIPWKHLMLACDTAEGVTEAARVAGDIATGHQARLTIFTVKEKGIASLLEGQFDALEKMMSRDVWLTVKPQCLIREGEPADEIVRMTEDTQADLLVMSAHCGNGLLTHLRSGTMAKVLWRSRCPAMILRNFRAPHHPQGTHHADHENVLL
ncbi:MAG: universal stress protein [Terriglobia bacterium]|nr:universal stress protein [Terriglobia bacterium]